MSIHTDRLPPIRIAMIAHDNKKADLVEWGRFNLALLARHELCATGTTGRITGDDLRRWLEGLSDDDLVRYRQ